MTRPLAGAGARVVAGDVNEESLAALGLAEQNARITGQTVHVDGGTLLP